MLCLVLILILGGACEFGTAGVNGNQNQNRNQNENANQQQVDAGPSCGDGVQQEHELCDGVDLDGHDCTTVGGGFREGTLACNATCDGWDTSGCVSPGCGDAVLDNGELCDGANLDGQDCTTVGGGFRGGALACNATCDGWDTTGCLDAICGDAVLHGDELCDGVNLDGQDCATIGAGFTRGSLACGAGCDDWDTTGCVVGSCGDGVLDATELCDTSELVGEDCVSLGQGFLGGTLGCGVFCDDWDTAACVADQCGNSQLDQAELCDVGVFGGETCASIGQGFSGGTLACNATCDGWDIAGCMGAATCGDGTVISPEKCDDGNAANLDGCNPTCNFRGLVNTVAGSADATGFADGPGTLARFHSPTAITSDGAYLYLTDSANCNIRRVCL